MLRLLRNSIIAIVGCSLAVSGLTVAPAHAASGTFTAEMVTIWEWYSGLGGGGIGSPLFCRPTSFLFYQYFAAGAITSGTQVAAGQIITANALGTTTGTPLTSIGCGLDANGHPQENLASGMGRINPFGLSGGPAGRASGSCGTTNVIGSAGAYTRVGSVVVLTLGPCGVDVTGPTGGTSHSDFNSITGVHVMYPDRPEQNGITNQWNEFMGPGVWAGTGS